MGAWYDRDYRGYIPDEVHAWKHELADATIAKIKKDGLTAAQMAKDYPTLRQVHVWKLMQGQMPGIGMLIFMAKAAGVKIRNTVVVEG